MARDLRNPRWMYLKAILLIAIGLIASTILLLESPHLRTALLLLVAIWGFCRAYYFAFYVIEQYIDPTYKFAGLWSFVRYVFRFGTSPRTAEGGCATKASESNPPKTTSLSS